jgi:hypothetical protein
MVYTVGAVTALLGCVWLGAIIYRAIRTTRLDEARLRALLGTRGLELPPDAAQVTRAYARYTFQSRYMRSNRHQPASLQLAIAVPLAIGGIIGAGHGSLMLANALADHGTTQLARPLANAKRTTSSKGRRTYHVHVASWRGRGRIETFVVRETLFQRIDVGRTRLSVATKPGRFCFAWLAAPLAIVQDPSPAPTLERRTPH